MARSETPKIGLFESLRRKRASWIESIKAETARQQATFQREQIEQDQMLIDGYVRDRSRKKLFDHSPHIRRVQAKPA